MGSVTAKYTFLTVDTPWAVRFVEASDCSVTPKIFDGPATETFAYRAGGGAAQSLFTGTDGLQDRVSHGLVVTWPVAACPTRQPYIYQDPSDGHYTYPVQYSGACLKTSFFHTIDTDTAYDDFAKTWVTERADGGLDCSVDQRVFEGFCVFNQGIVAEVPTWIDGGTDLGEIDPGQVRLEPIH